MATFEYSSSIGNYDAAVKSEITFRIKGGSVTKEEYETLTTAFSTIEELAKKYQAELDVVGE